MRPLLVDLAIPSESPGMHGGNLSDPFFDVEYLCCRHIGVVGVVKTGLKWAIPSVITSVVFDSILWGR